MKIGLIKWFEVEKGFGVLSNPDEGDFFFHINNFELTPETLNKGASVIYNSKFDNVKQRNIAINCRLINQKEDWYLALNYLNKNDGIVISLKVQKRTKYKTISYNQDTEISLLKNSTKQFFNIKTDDELFEIITEYYRNHLDKKLFVKFCDLIQNYLGSRNKFSYLFEETEEEILINLYNYFGENADNEILFQVWKNSNFKYIGLEKNKENEIAESILNNYLNEIGIPELSRIKKYSFGNQFCNSFIFKLFDKLPNLNRAEIEILYDYLIFLDFENEQEYRLVLDNELFNKYWEEIKNEISKLPVIETINDFNNYNKLINYLPLKIKNIKEEFVKSEIHKIIVNNCSEKFKSELWLMGFEVEPNHNQLMSKFLNNESTEYERCKVLSYFNLEDQLNSLISYSKISSIEKALLLLEEFVYITSKQNSNINRKDILIKAESLKGENCYELIIKFNDYIVSNTTGDEKFDLFFKNIFRYIPEENIFNKLNELEYSKLYKIFSSDFINTNTLKKILFIKIKEKKQDDYHWLYDLADEFLESNDFSDFDNYVFNTIEIESYFDLWKHRKAKIFPKIIIEEILNDNYNSYIEIDYLIRNNGISNNELISFLFDYLNLQQLVTDRKIFYKQLNHIKYLVKTDELLIDKIKNIGNDFYNIILWVLGKDKELNFNLLKTKFIYFSSEDQVLIIKKLFNLKAKNEFDLTIEKLDELTRFDLDLYKTNLQFNPDILIDISTDIIIKALKSYKVNNRFISESELISLALDDIKNNKKQKFQLSNYFEECKGRSEAEFDWKTRGKIIKDNDNWKIEFEYDSDLVNEVKKIPNRKYNSENKCWHVPLNEEEAINEFAKNNQFFIIKNDNNHYKNNTHLAEFKRKSIPNGIKFCEGRMANKQNEIFNKDFWWCCGQTCFQKCETIHTTDEWEKYTLLDFCEILGLNTDEINRMSDFISKGNYYKFIGLINRFNQLLERMYCEDCNEILYPIDAAHFAAHFVVRFHCVNDKCSNNNEIYLNHCLNGQCNSIIDSRVSKKCKNGLFICSKCGSCCSHDMLQRRLNNLQTTGGYIHSNLINCVENKLGHLEKAEYFCYNCSNYMEEIAEELFKCNKCNIIYDTKKYKFKRPHIHLRKKQPLDNNRNNTIDDVSPF